MFEKYLPEIEPTLKEYNEYIKANSIFKTNEEKLADYFCIISQAYQYNSDKREYEFIKPDIKDFFNKESEDTLQKRDFLFCVVNLLSHRLRAQSIKDRIEGFSEIVKDEMYNRPEGCQREFGDSWFYKIFPAQEQMSNNTRYDIVRYGINVKPSVGLFKKLDALCLKYDAYNYKVINEQEYNKRQDPIIIYAKKENQSEMQKELANLIAPYRRKDEYDALGYNNLGNGIFVADEVKREDVIALQCQILSRQEKDVFEHPDPDEWTQEEREYDLEAEIRKKGGLKRKIYSYFEMHKFDRSMSNAQFQVCKMLVTAYKKSREHKRERQSVKTI